MSPTSSKGGTRHQRIRAQAKLGAVFIDDHGACGRTCTCARAVVTASAGVARLAGSTLIRPLLGSSASAVVAIVETAGALRVVEERPRREEGIIGEIACTSWGEA